MVGRCRFSRLFLPTLLVLLLSSTTTPVTAICGTDYTGNTFFAFDSGTALLDSLAPSSEDACCAACTAIPYCVGFELDLDTLTCDLHQLFGRNDTVEIDVIGGLDRIRVNVRNDRQTATCQSDFDVGTGRILSSIRASVLDYVHPNATDQLACCDACSSIEGCVGWTLHLVNPVTGALECTMHTDIGPPPGPTVVETVDYVHGLRPTSGAASTCGNYTIVTNTAPAVPYLSDQTFVATSQTQCCDACTAHATCNVWRVEPMLNDPWDPAGGFNCSLYEFTPGTPLVNVFPALSFTGVALSLDSAPQFVDETILVDRTTSEDVPFEFRFLANESLVVDPDGDALTVTALAVAGDANDLGPFPDWLTFTISPPYAYVRGTATTSQLGSHLIAIVATGGSLSTTRTFTITVLPNVPPFVAVPLIPPPRPSIGDQFSYRIPYGAFRDPNPGTVLSYEVTLDGIPVSLVPWLFFDQTSRIISGVPPSSQNFTLGVLVTDPSNSSVFDDMPLNVNFPPEPALNLDDIFAIVALPSVTVFGPETFRDTDGDLVVMTVLQPNNREVDAWFDWAFSSATGSLTISGTATPADIGSYDIIVVSSDETVEASSFIPLTVHVAANRPPTVQLVPVLPLQVINIGDLINISFAGRFGDADAGDSLVIEAGPLGYTEFSGAPWLELDLTYNTVFGVPGSNASGVTDVNVIATDVAGQFATFTFSVEVEPDIASSFFNETTNVTEIDFGLPPDRIRPFLDTRVVQEDVPFPFELPIFQTFTDPEERPLDIIVRRANDYGLPDFLTYVPEEQTLYGNPTNDDVGATDLQVWAYNDLGLSNFVRLRIVVLNANDGPDIVGPAVVDLEVDANTPLTSFYNLTTIFVDPDGDDLVFSVNATVVPGGGASDDSWIVTLVDDENILSVSSVLVPGTANGLYRIVTTGVDAEGLTAQFTVNLNVLPSQDGTTVAALQWSPCSKDCGLGKQRRVTFCSNERTELLPDSACPQFSKTPSEQECNVDVCPITVYHIEEWESCDGRCQPELDVGLEPVTFREVTCLYDEDPVAWNHCDDVHLARPRRKRDCNTAPCDGGVSWQPQPWSNCTATCGYGTKERENWCVRGVATRVNALLCDPDMEPPRSATCVGTTCPCEVLDSVSANVSGIVQEVFQSNTCSGNATCVDGQCECNLGWTSPTCDIQSANSFVRDCFGTFDMNGECCPITRFLNDAGICCAVGEVLDKDGVCCNGGVDACGVCGGDALYVDREGVCCASVPAANHRCCTLDPGLDECGTCGGSNDCPLLMGVLMNYPYVTQDVFVPTTEEAVAVEVELREAFAGRLELPATRLFDVIVEPQYNDSIPTELVVNFTVTVEALNEAWGNETLEQQSPILPGNRYLRVVGGVRAPECGNGACEFGESCQDETCSTGCPADCAQWGFMVPCPVPPVATKFPTLPCSGRGVCEPMSGACLCYKGYAGDDCATCDVGYEVREAQGVATCVRIPPQTCFDGFQNQGENGTDCEGPCPSVCPTPIPEFVVDCNSTLYNATLHGNCTDLTDGGDGGDGGDGIAIPSDSGPGTGVIIGASIGGLAFLVCCGVCIRFRAKNARDNKFGEGWEAEDERDTSNMNQGRRTDHSEMTGGQKRAFRAQGEEPVYF